METASNIIQLEKHMTPTQKWRAKIKSDPSYEEYRETIRAKKRAAYQASREGKKDGRQIVKLIEGGRVCVTCGEGKQWDCLLKTQTRIYILI